MEDLLGWFLVFIFLISLLGILSYQLQLMYLTDLEGDYINPYDSAAQINMLVFPEFFTQGTLCILFLITEHWFMFLLSLPYLYFNVRLYTRRQHLVDVTEIYSQLTWEKHLRLYKLCYLIILLVLCIFWLLWTVGRDKHWPGISAPYKFAHSFSCGSAEILTVGDRNLGDFANLINSQFKLHRCIIVLVESFIHSFWVAHVNMFAIQCLLMSSLLVPFKFLCRGV